MMSLLSSASSPQKQPKDFLTRCGLENVLDLTPMAVYCCDLEGKIVYYNQQAADVWGRSPNTEETTEKFCGSYKIYNLDGSYLPHERCPMGKAILDRLPAHSGEIIIERPDQSWVYAKAHIRELTNKNGEIIGAINFLKDVSSEKELHKAYKTTSDNFRFLTDNIPQMVWMANLKGEIDYFNLNWLSYSELPIEELKAKGWASITHPQDLTLIQDCWQKAIQALAPLTITIRLKRGADHTYRWFLVKAVLMNSQKGEETRWFGTCTDIHDQKEAEEALHRSQRNLKDFLENSNIGLHWVNAEGIIIWANKAEYEMLGYSREEYIGMPIAKFHADTHVIEDILKRLSNRELLKDYPAKLFCKDGSSKEVLINSSVLWEEDKFVHTRCFTRDVTIQKQAEFKLKEKNKILQKVNQKLLLINHQLDTFVYVASHDLKTPITNLESLIDLLSTSIDEEILREDNIQRTFNYISVSILKLKSTIHNLTKIDELQKNLEILFDEGYVNLADLVAEVLQDVAGLIQETQAVIHTDFEQAKTLHFSRTSLKTIFYSLINNSMKFRDPDRHPLLQISSENGGGYFKIIITDNGLGFSKLAQNKVFNLFKRFHPHIEGSGISLFIVKKIIEHAGGHITLESKQGIGSTFKICLPADT